MMTGLLVWIAIGMVVLFGLVLAIVVRCGGSGGEGLGLR